MAKEFAVIGLGRFGASLATTLARLGADVLGVDVDEEKVRAISPKITQAVQGDATDENVLLELGIRNFDVVVVGMSGFEASLLVTSYLKEMGVPKVVVKAQSDIHGKILQKMGADTIVFPEKDMGERVAFSLLSGSVIDHIELADDYSVAEVAVVGSLAGRTLRSLNLRTRLGLNVVAIKSGDTVNTYINPDEPLREGDILIVLGPNDGVHRLNQVLEKG